MTASVDTYAHSACIIKYDWNYNHSDQQHCIHALLRFVKSKQNIIISVHQEKNTRDFFQTIPLPPPGWTKTQIFEIHWSSLKSLNSFTCIISDAVKQLGEDCYMCSFWLLIHFWFHHSFTCSLKVKFFWVTTLMDVTQIGDLPEKKCN